MQNIFIQPYEEVLTYRINRIEIHVTMLELNVRAYITTVFFDDNNIQHRLENAVIDGDEYKQWQTDDYIINWVCSKYGLSLV